jgi:predicted enzyme related to lactoylglutathione lyase
MVIVTSMQERINTGGICHIAIDARDLERSTKFYTDMYTMNIVSRSSRIVQLITSGADDAESSSSLSTCKRLATQLTTYVSHSIVVSIEWQVSRAVVISSAINGRDVQLEMFGAS